MSKSLSILFGGVAFTFAIAASAAPNDSSYNNDPALWQQFKAKQGIAELDAEINKRATPLPPTAPLIAPIATPRIPVLVSTPVSAPTAIPEPVVVVQNGHELKDCPILCPDMVVISPGKFLRGSPATEEGRNANEGPQHEITIAYSFAIGKSHITRAEWERCVADEKCPVRTNNDKLLADYPVIGVSWNDAQRYIVWLNKKTGKNYRLLSESEWEFVARAGSHTAYWWGDDFDKSKFPKPLNGNKIMVRESIPANPWGVPDMIGNVPEWVQDCWHDSFVYQSAYDAPPFDGSAWITSVCSQRVVRGAPFNAKREEMRSANRNKQSAGYSGLNFANFNGTNLGFRISRTIAPVEVNVR